MILKCVSPNIFNDIFPPAETVYGSMAFNLLNEYKAVPVPADALVAPGSRLAWVVGEADGVTLGLVLGYRGGKWHAPFSAPFAEVRVAGVLKVEHVRDFASQLPDLLGVPVEVTLSPAIYDMECIPLLVEGLTDVAEKRIDDCNFHYPTAFADDFKKHLNNSSRNKYNQAQRVDFQFEKTDDLARAYAVIKANRESHGYRLAMNLEQVAETVAEVVKADYFILGLDGVDVASAIVFHVSPRVVQVIYWGDVPGYSRLRQMNLLPIRIMQYYAKLGIEIVDVGPASTDGIRNDGLAAFKLSLGCIETPKSQFILSPKPLQISPHHIEPVR